MTDNGYCFLSERGLAKFSGPDAQAFLHAQLTCDVNALGLRAWTYGAYCTPKGRALATFALWPAGEADFLMQMPVAVCEPVRKRLAMYILRAKVQSADATGEYLQCGVAGPAASELVSRIVGRAPDGPHGLVHGEHAMALTLAPERHLLIAPRAEADAVERILSAAARRESERWWQALDIAAGIASVLRETQEQFVPQMLNLDAVGGVSFNKGCYPGQEIVARMHYLGRLKERLFRARIAGAAQPHPGDKVYGADLGAQAAGMIVNAVPAPEHGHEVLAVVQLSSVAAGPVRLGSPDGPELAMAPLPYALPAKG